MSTVTLIIRIPPEVKAALGCIAEQAKQGPNPVSSTEDLVMSVLSSLADGFARSGSWERTML